MTQPKAATVNDDGEFRTYDYPVDGRLLWSVTAAIGGTNNKPWIARWYGTMSARWCVEHLMQLARVVRVKTREFMRAGMPRDEAREAARAAAVDLAKDTAKIERELKADAGSHVHAVIKALVAWAKMPAGLGALIELPPIPEHLADAWYSFGNGEGAPLKQVVSDMVDGFQNFVHAFGFSMTIVESELTVYNVELGYAGTLDLIITLTGYAISYGTGPNGQDEIVACPGSVLVIVVDAKTGKALEGTWKEQVVAYMLGTEVADWLGNMRAMRESDAGAVLHLRPDYPDGWNLYLVSARDSAAAWERFKIALRLFTERQEVRDKPGTVIRPLRADGTLPGLRLCDVANEGYSHALAPLRNALGAGAELEDIARFTADELLAVKGIGPKVLGTIRQMLADHRLHLAGEAPAREQVAA
jgi:hypothetical protein